jgi:predicted HicB family RNase H-like nuclease
MMKHKGYLGRAWLDDEADLFHGEVANIRDVVTFQGASVSELRRAFVDSVEDYLDLCRERGEEPDKPFSGNFMVRLAPELHQRIALLARLKGESLNSWVAETLQSAAEEESKSKPYREADGAMACEKRKRYRKAGSNSSS